MSEKERTAYLEIAITGLLAVISAALIWDSLDLPESLREPLGSATIPQVVCGLVIVFCAILIVRSLRIIARERGRSEAERAPETTAFRRRFDLAAWVFVLAVVYVALMQSRLIPSEILTPAFLGGAILILNGFRRAAILPALVIALVVGLGTNLLFTDFFYVDLP